MLVMLSAIVGIWAMYLDLNNPGSLEARNLNDTVNVIFGLTILLSLPLLAEKIKRFEAWHDNYDMSTDKEKSAIIWSIGKPILYKIGFVIVLAFIIAIIMQSYFGFDAETVAQYKEFYSTPKPITFP